MRCSIHGCEMDYLGEIHGFEQWSCPVCVAEEEALFSGEGDNYRYLGSEVLAKLHGSESDDFDEEPECPYCGAIAKEVNRNQYNVLFECPGCGYITSTEIEDIRKRNDGQ